MTRQGTIKCFGRAMLVPVIGSLVCALAMSGPAWGVSGFNVVVQDNFGEGGIGTTVDNINEGETLLSLGGAPEATVTPTVINYTGQGGTGSIGGDSTFPGSFNFTDDFALGASGYVTGISTEYGLFRLVVNSDDGFRVRRNGMVVGESVGPKGPSDVGFYALLANGDQLDLAFFERGGGEEVEFFRQDTRTGVGNNLVNTAASGILIDTAPTAAATAQPIFSNIGWTVKVQTAAATPGVVGTTVDNVNEGDTLLALGGTPETGDHPYVINYGTFPSGTPGDNFALSATGRIDVLDPSGSEDVYFYVNSDDGFRLRIDGVVVSEFVNATGGSNTMSPLVTVKDGSEIDLTFFELGGGQFVSLYRDFDGLLSTTDDRALVGLSESGLLIGVPEPSALAMLLGLGGIGLVGWMRRRRRS